MDLFLNRTLGKIRLHRQVISEAKQIWSAISWVDKLHSWCSCGRLYALAKKRYSSEYTAFQVFWLLLCCDSHKHLLASLMGRWDELSHPAWQKALVQELCLGHFSLSPASNSQEVRPSKTQWYTSLWSWLAMQYEGFLKKWLKSVFWEKSEKISRNG